MIFLAFWLNINAQNFKLFADTNSIIIRSDDSAHLAFPDIIRLENDSLLVVYREGKTHIDSTGFICAQIGSPDAKFWSKPFVLIDSIGLDERDCSLEKIDNRIYYNYFGYHRGDALKKPTLVHIHAGIVAENGRGILSNTQVDSGNYVNDFLVISHENYWVDRNNNPIMGHASSSGMYKVNDSLSIISYGGNPLVRKAGTKDFLSPVSKLFIFSSLNGIVWNERQLKIPNSDTVWMQEPSVLRINDSVLIVHVRTAFGKSIFNAGSMAQILSYDSGKTWTGLKYFDFTGHSPELFQFNDSIIISGFRLLNKEYTAEKTAVIYSQNSGKTWSEPIIVEDCGEKECAYPAFEKLADGQVVIVYYSDDGHSIKLKYLQFE